MQSSSHYSPPQKIAYNSTCFIPKGDVVEKIVVNDIESTEENDIEEPKEHLSIIEKINKQVKRKTSKQELEAEHTQQLINQGYKPKDGNDPLIYSHTLGLGPYSFITFDYKYRPTSPPPTYLNNEELYKLTTRTKNDNLKGFIIPKEGGLMCVDKDILKKQSGIIATMIGQLISTMCLSKISMPVRIFEARTTLERIADLWRCAPIYLSEAAKSEDKVERMKKVIAFTFSSLYTSMKQLKPFNPLIGETLEATLADGTEILLEHTSHHPPISNFIVEGPNDSYRMYGHHEYRGHVSTNGLGSEEYGPNMIEFKDGGKIEYWYPKFKIHGLLMGDRTAYISEEMVFEDKENKLKAVLVFNYGKKKGFFSSRKKGTKIDDVEGVIYKVKPNANAKHHTKLKDLKNIEKKLCSITGSWLGSLRFDEKSYWSIDEVELPALKFKENPLPTDWRYREDLIWLRRGNIEIAQEWKLRLEIEQRRDRSTREKYKPNKK
jgi:hypothetical protein